MPESTSRRSPLDWAALPVIVFSLLGSACVQGQVLVIADVTAINPRQRTIAVHVSVIVENGRIRTIQAASAETPKKAQVVQGRGKFLIPGLWDAHVHLTKAGALSLPLFVANGITGVRDMGSDFAEVSQWRAEIQQGKRIGPRIKTSGQILEARSNVERMKRDGTVEPVDRIRIGVSNPDEGVAAVDRLADAGVDHIKMRTTPNVETFRAVAKAAKRQKLPFAAHPLDFGGSLGMGEGPRELLRSGLQSVEHLIAFPPLDSLSPAQRRSLFLEMARSGVFLSNTMVNLDTLVSLPHPEAKKRVEDASGKIDDRRKYVCGYLVEDWCEQVEESKEGPYEVLRRHLPQVYRDFREMHENGVQFLAGTDVGVLFMYPGFSMHDELERLVRDLNFHPMEALRTATYGLAAFYHAEQDFGSLEPGRAADLVLLDADPASDIRNTRRIQGVITAGRWLDRAALDQLLRDVEKAAASGCAAAHCQSLHACHAVQALQRDHHIAQPGLPPA